MIDSCLLQCVLVGCNSPKCYCKPKPYWWPKHLRFAPARSYRKENNKQCLSSPELSRILLSYSRKQVSVYVFAIGLVTLHQWIYTTVTFTVQCFKEKEAKVSWIGVKFQFKAHEFQFSSAWKTPNMHEVWDFKTWLGVKLQLLTVGLWKNWTWSTEIQIIIVIKKLLQVCIFSFLY